MRESLERGLPELGLDAALIPTLEGFAQLVLERNQVMNLTAITQPEEFAALHLLDSLALVLLAGLERQSVVDVGCGAGFPGVPIAIADYPVDNLGSRDRIILNPIHLPTEDFDGVFRSLEFLLAMAGFHCQHLSAHLHQRQAKLAQPSNIQSIKTCSC